MIRALYITILLLTSLEARENPFFPAEGEKEISYTTNKVQNIELFKRSSITLPSSARIIKKVTIEYENLDATVETRSIELKNKVDWHLPIFISQNFSELPQKTDKELIQKKEIQEFKLIASRPYVKFFENFKSLKIVTNDRIIRDFLLVKPHRIVLDFKRDRSVKSYSKENKNSRFVKIRIGNHEGYYRTVIELDGLYRYTMKEVSDGYIFNLR